MCDAKVQTLPPGAFVKHALSDANIIPVTQSPQTADNHIMNLRKKLIFAALLAVTAVRVDAGGATVMVYVQSAGLNETLRIAVEEGAMTHLFNNGYIALNALPTRLIPELTTHQENLWLRSLADDIGADHLLFIDCSAIKGSNTALDGSPAAFTGSYTLIEIARPGNLADSAIHVTNANRRSSRDSAENLGKNIAKEILTALP